MQKNCRKVDEDENFSNGVGSDDFFGKLHAAAAAEFRTANAARIRRHAKTAVHAAAPAAKFNAEKKLR